MDQKKILIIDDDPAHVKLLKVQLEHNNYNVITASEGRQGIKIARNENPDLIILDVLLPGINGFEVCKILKNDDNCKNIPVAMLTSVYITDKDKKEGLKLGADTYVLKADVFLSKPFDYKRLLAAVNELLKGRKKAEKEDEPEKNSILIVDDDVNNLELLKVRLDQGDFEIETATDAFAGLAALEKREFDLILLDIQMPGKSGVEMLAEVRERFPDTGVVMMTAYESVESAISTLKTGAADYLVKPLDHRSILKTVFDNINKNRLRVKNERLITQIRQSNIDQMKRYNLVNDLNRKLKQAREAADAASRAKSQFLAVMSHEIRTPLNAVIGVTNLLMQTELDQKQLRYAELMRSGANTLLSVISNILDFSKIEAGKAELEITDFNISTLVEEIAELMTVKAHDKGLRFACLTHHLVPSDLRGDPGRVRQILLNLAENAVKFTRKGDIVIRVSPDNETDTHATLRFTVTDTGIGISHDRLKLLFKSFSQADASVKRKYGGTGLGLAISKQLIKMMKGNIGVESKEGKGSTFWFTVVFEKQSEQSETSLSDQARDEDNSGIAIHTLAKADKRDLRILLVEDNEINRELAVAILEGYTVITVTNGKEALEILKKEKFDLVLMDIEMPEMDGFEATSLIRNPKSGVLSPGIPIIAMTAYAMKGDRERCLDADMDDYISKPVETRKLFEAIDRLVPAEDDKTNVL